MVPPDRILYDDRYSASEAPITLGLVALNIVIALARAPLPRQYLADLVQRAGVAIPLRLDLGGVKPPNRQSTIRELNCVAGHQIKPRSGLEYPGRDPLIESRCSDSGQSNDASRKPHIRILTHAVSALKSGGAQAQLR